MPWWDIDARWPQVEHWITDALEGRSLFYTPTMIRDECEKRAMVMWLAMDGQEPVAVAVTRIMYGVRGSWLTVVLLAGGRMRDWMRLGAELEDYAKAQGCMAIEGWGRKGWERMTAPLGWKPMFTVCRKVFADAE